MADAGISELLSQTLRKKFGIQEQQFSVKVSNKDTHLWKGVGPGSCGRSTVTVNEVVKYIEERL
jgi:hypothetical protein